MVTPIDTTINPNITEVSPDYQENLKLFIDNIKICPANCRRKGYIKNTSKYIMTTIQHSLITNYVILCGYGILQPQ